MRHYLKKKKKKDNNLPRGDNPLLVSCHTFGDENYTFSRSI